MLDLKQFFALLVHQEICTDEWAREGYEQPMGSERPNNSLPLSDLEEVVQSVCIVDSFYWALDLEERFNGINSQQENTGEDFQILPGEEVDENIAAGVFA